MLISAWNVSVLEEAEVSPRCLGVNGRFLIRPYEYSNSFIKADIGLFNDYSNWLIFTIREPVTYSLE